MFTLAKGMPPFDPSWFGPLKDPYNPLGALRLTWILLNESFDKNEAWEQQKWMAEYTGFFTNPSFYRQFKNHISANEIQAGELVIVKENKDYDHRMNAALQGKIIYRDHPEIVDWLNQKRAQREALRNPPDPRIHTVPTEADYRRADTLVVEKVPRPPQPPVIPVPPFNKK